MNRPLNCLALCLTLCSTAQARSPSDAPRLPAPQGRVIRVDDVEQLYRAVAAIKSGTTIVLRKGEYRLHRPIHFAGQGLKQIALRGETGRSDDVVVRGAGMNNLAVHHGVLANAVDGLLVADMTIGWVGYHPIAVQPKCRRVHIRNCRLVDAGEQFIKASSGGDGTGVDNGIVEYCTLEYTKTGPPNGYTNGVDVHGGDHWIIRDNLFRNIRTPPGAKYKHVPAVLMWNGASDTICENNTFVNCDRAIAFGLVKKEKFPDHRGGVIRNNFIYVDKGAVPHADVGIFVVSPGAKVLHNTILLNGSYPNAIETRWAATKNVVVHNNLTDARITPREQSQVHLNGNVTNASGSMFQSPRDGDLHARGAPPRAATHPDCKLDWDGKPRGRQRTTVGADEP
ncbi:MAG: right-handed parallel beta-helix repeat-containing protein [Pirellulaceae bacterium]|jgi:hypothetical protein|nr:right-handed parallel beta-helix repeat-containing protein [Pirellulaceae bacterium]MDP7017543.1 right-handed parallel beta-helix repeat-containing protein [Pirellulaceae bacterium]